MSNKLTLRKYDKRIVVGTYVDIVVWRERVNRPEGVVECHLLGVVVAVKTYIGIRRKLGPQEKMRSYDVSLDKVIENNRQSDPGHSFHENWVKLIRKLTREEMLTHCDLRVRQAAKSKRSC